MADNSTEKDYNNSELDATYVTVLSFGKQPDIKPEIDIYLEPESKGIGFSNLIYLIVSNIIHFVIQI